MNLQEIRLKNFKCFKETKIQCSKFTLLTGANSSGKSSILYGLLGAIQTKAFPFYFSPNGSYVTMGDFGELAFQHSNRTPFGVGFSFMDDQKNQFLTDSMYRENPKTKLPKLRSLSYSGFGFSLEVSSNKKKFNARYLFNPEEDPSFKFSQSEEMRQGLLGLLRAGEMAAQKTRKAKTKEIGKSSKALVKKMFHFQRKGSFHFTDANELLNLRHNSLFIHKRLASMEHLLSMFDANFNFISSFRLSPERTYYQKTKAALKVDKFGDNAVDQIIEWEHSDSKKMLALKKSLKTLDLAHELKTEKYSGGRFDIRVVPADSRLESSLCDVGFGVSQFLPILVADMQLEKGSTLMVSQPEIHLHPSIQANLADYFSDQANQLGKRYILETHSEYLINRFRLLVAKGKLKEDDVSVYYLGWKAGTPTPYRIHFKKNGQIEGAPKDFFATYMMDVMNIAMNV